MGAIEHHSALVLSFFLSLFGSCIGGANAGLPATSAALPLLLSLPPRLCPSSLTSHAFFATAVPRTHDCGVPIALLELRISKPQKLRLPIFPSSYMVNDRQQHGQTAVLFLGIPFVDASCVAKRMAEQCVLFVSSNPAQDRLLPHVKTGRSARSECSQQRLVDRSSRTDPALFPGMWLKEVDICSIR